MLCMYSSTVVTAQPGALCVAKLRYGQRTGCPRTEQHPPPPISAGLRNYLSYWAVEDYIYLGLRRPLRRFRKRLGLPPLRAVEGRV
jgi:hypothetical protein